MLSPRVQDIHKRIINLSPQEKLSLLSKLLPEVSREINKQGKRDIYDLKGVGKEISHTRCDTTGNRHRK
jgi:hypothetical protein